MHQAVDAFKDDTFDSYKQGCDQGREDALNIDPDVGRGARLPAPTRYTVRWGEHGTDERSRAEEHIEAAKKAKGDNKLPQLLAAEALFQYYNGKGADARRS